MTKGKSLERRIQKGNGLLENLDLLEWEPLFGFGLARMRYNAKNQRPGIFNYMRKAKEDRNGNKLLLSLYAYGGTQLSGTLYMIDKIF